MSVALNYHPRGAAVELLRSKAPEVLISGPAGTGKSLACLWKLHYCLSNVPGLRALICRKTRVSLTESGLVTFERDVLPQGHPARVGPNRANRHLYRYPNGAELVVGGIDRPSRIMSTDYDLVYLQEATEFDEADLEPLTTRLRHGKLRYQQLLMDCNPDRPTHWLYRRSGGASGRGRCLRLESRHEDNPRYWDGRKWTAEGVAYLAKLDALTGARKLRLRDGRWTQAEGVVYEGWDPAVHLVDPFPVPHDWPRLLAIDFGFVHPFVCQWWALDPDNRLYLYREIYRSGRLVEDHARDILRYTSGEHGNTGPEPAPVAVICDHDAEDRATLERHLGWETTPALKLRQAGVQAVAARLKRAGDGKPRLFIHRGALVEKDAALDEAKKPTCTVDEFDGYVWHPKKPDEPVKEHDHGMDAMRYVVYTLDGDEGQGQPTSSGRRVLV